MAKKTNAKRLAHVSESGALTPQQEEFCRQYVITLSIKQALLAAGYAAEATQSQGSRLMKDPRIAEFIQKLMDERSERTAITADRVLEKIWALADFDLADAYDNKGRLKSVHDMPVELRKAIAGIEVFEEYEGTGNDRIYVGDTKKVKLFDRLKALELMGRHLKLFTDKVEVDVSSALADRLAKARKRNED